MLPPSRAVPLMPKSYRLTIYANGLIDRMLPFDAQTVGEAMTFADSQRYGRHAILSDAGGLVKMYPSDDIKGILPSLVRPVLPS